MFGLPLLKRVEWQDDFCARGTGTGGTFPSPEFVPIIMCNEVPSFEPANEDSLSAQPAKRVELIKPLSARNIDEDREKSSTMRNEIPTVESVDEDKLTVEPIKRKVSIYVYNSGKISSKYIMTYVGISFTTE